MNLTEFLKPRLFDKLGMGDVPCYCLPDGTQMGGAGSRLTTDQMARFIQFVANRGVWDGERLLNEAWFDLATNKQIDNSASSAWPDWTQGYCFQFWRCAQEGVFRADGAFGQFGVVCPKQDAIFVITSASTNFNEILEVLWEVILPAFHDDALNPNEKDNIIMNYVLENNQITPLMSSRIPWAEAEVSGKSYSGEYTGNWCDLIGGAGIGCRGALGGIAEPFTTNKMTEISVNFTKSQLELSAKVGEEIQTLPVSLESSFNSFELCGKTYGAVGSWVTPKVFEFLAYCAEAATGSHFFLTFRDDKLNLTSISAYPEDGGLNDGKEPALDFTLIK